MIDSILGIPVDDIYKIKKLMNTYYIKDIDTLIACFDEAKILTIEKGNLIKERDRINKLLDEIEG